MPDGGTDLYSELVEQAQDGEYPAELTLWQIGELIWLGGDHEADPTGHSGRADRVRRASHVRGACRGRGACCVRSACCVRGRDGIGRCGRHDGPGGIGRPRRIGRPWRIGWVWCDGRVGFSGRAGFSGGPGGLSCPLRPGCRGLAHEAHSRVDTRPRGQDSALQRRHQRPGRGGQPGELVLA